MPITNTMRNKKNPANSLRNVRIRRTNSQTVAPMMKQSVVPAGVYTSKISAVTMSQTQQGDEAVDVIHELTDAKGMVVQGRIRYPLDSYHFDRLGDALIAAGLPEGSSIVDAVGIEETLEIVYPQRNSLAKIKSRRPLSVAKAQQTKAVEAAEVDEEDDYDDFLPDEDEDDF